MPKRQDIKRILVIGSGPIIIGQAAEFDYAGTQACISLREEGYEVILVNSNPATIMTDKEMADKVYIEPLTYEFMSRILRKERPDAILATLGGQTGLNMALELAESGLLDELKIELLGTKLQAIKQAEDRELFKALMLEINEPIPESTIVHSIEEAVLFSNQIGYPVIVRPAYTLGGTGGGICDNEENLRIIVENGLKVSPVHQCLIEVSIAGYKEIEYEVMRDQHNNAIVVCNMENFDPVGIHTGDSIVFAPSQTLTDVEYQLLRDASLKIIRSLKIEGGCNVQLALDPNSYNYYVIEVNPRVSRSSALASKATGYPIAKIAAKIAIGLTLDEIKNPVTLTTFAQFEPTLDYVVAKIPRWPFDKFSQADRRLGTQMKATGEVMAMGRTLEEALLKAVRSLEIGTTHIFLEECSRVSNEKLALKLIKAEDDRIFYLMEALIRGYSLDELFSITKIDRFFLDKLLHIQEIENELKLNKFNLNILARSKQYGFSDVIISKLWECDIKEVRNLRKHHNIVPVYKMVDTCAAEFSSLTPYFYSSYEFENESIVSDRESILVLGSGPIRIGQGIEFDYATVHCVKAIQKAGYEAIIINSNPETVSTDFSIADKLYFEPLTLEDVLNVIDLEKPKGVIVQFGGQTAINLAEPLNSLGVTILGTSIKDLDIAEDRKLFEHALTQLSILQPKGAAVNQLDDAINIADSIGYPVLVRPSYVIGGRAMEIVEDKTQLIKYMENAFIASPNRTILIDRYLRGKECEVDAICDGTTVLIPGIMEHIERAGIHSGDSMAVYPPQSLSNKIKKQIEEITCKLALGLNCIGLMNIQFIIQNETVYVIEVNPRASRTVPFLSKITHIPMAQVATQVILGQSLSDLGYRNGLYPEPNTVHVKAPVFSFTKLKHVDSYLGPEMKSTGEVMGSDVSLEKALYKAFSASGYTLSDHGNVLFTIDDSNKEEAIQLAKRLSQIGYKLFATKGTSQLFESYGLKTVVVSKINEQNSHNLIEMIETNQFNMVINTMGQDKDKNSDGFIIRHKAIEYGIALFTSLDTASAIIKVLESRSFNTQSL